MRQVEYRLTERFLPGAAPLRAARLRAVLEHEAQRAGGSAEQAGGGVAAGSMEEIGGGVKVKATPEGGAAEAGGTAPKMSAERGDAGCGRPSTAG